MSGLGAEQLDELEELISDLLEQAWDRGKGHPRELTLREAIIVASGYARNNIIEEIWAEIFDVNQSTISRYISFLTPLIDKVTAEFRPSADEAAEATKGAIALAGGVFGDKGFIGTDYITTPIRKPQDRDLYIREHDYNNQTSTITTTRSALIGRR